MNLTQPPFDDVHVRRAMNFIMDKHALVQAWGGPLVGDVANHIVPDSLLSNLLSDYAPYKTAGDHGSVAKAKEAMKGSKYDTDKNGTCGATECKNVLLIADTRQVDTKMLPVIAAERARRSASPSRCARSRARTRRSRRRRRTSRSPSGPAGGRTTPTRTPSSARCSTAARSSRPATRTTRSSGSRPSQCKSLKVTGNCTNVPSVNKRPRQVRQPRRSAAHTACYAALDKKLMTHVVPWVPYLWSTVTRITSKNVTKYEFDQFATTPAYAHLAVK